MKETRGPRIALVRLAAALALGVAAIAARWSAGQDVTRAPAVFGSAVELVRIDAVVLDAEGRPVSGLAASDFEVAEDGTSRPIASFEPVVVRALHAAPSPDAPRLSAARLRAPSEGRCMLLFVDDVHLSAAAAGRLQAALRRFLAADVREGDWITLVAPWQQLWWTARGGWEYRQLADVLSHLKGQSAGDSHGDWAMARSAEYGPMGTRGESPAVGSAGRGSATSGGAGQFAVVGDPRAPVKQEQAVAGVRQRTSVTLGALQQALESLVAVRGRKSLVMVSEGFVLLPNMPGYREAIDTARRANVAIHFVDPRGVQAAGSGTALSMTLGDALGITEATGGIEVSGNDTEAGLRQIVAEADAYYLLGYEPAKPGPGERTVSVRVTRPGLTVRARSRYFVAPAEARSASEAHEGRQKRGKGAPEPALAAVRSLADATDLPLRTTVFFHEANRKGEVATLLATEVVPPPGRSGERLYRLVSEARARDGGPPVLDRFEGSPQVTPGVPVVLARQWSLPPGVWQVRLFVEDVAAGRIGTLVHTFEVPDARRFRMSTPLLTAELDDPNGRRRPKVALGRTFRTGTLLYCQYSVYGAPPAGRHDWVPHVLGSWTLTREGAGVRESAPSLIQPAPDGRLTRTLGISLQGLPPGEYVLAVAARDETSGETLTRKEPFTVAP